MYQWFRAETATAPAPASEKTEPHREKQEVIVWIMKKKKICTHTTDFSVSTAYESMFDPHSSDGILRVLCVCAFFFKFYCCRCCSSRAQVSEFIRTTTHTTIQTAMLLHRTQVHCYSYTHAHTQIISYMIYMMSI